METIAVRECDIVANFHCPSTSGTHPGVIVIGGAGGGLESANAVGSLLADAGYAALALAYFGLEDLPTRLEEVPLEYFKQAIEYMRSHPSVAASKIGLIGTSKGGEGALLVSATYREIGAVVAYSPSHVVFQGIAETGLNETTAKSSWTLDSKPVPFVPFRLNYDCIDRYGFYLGLYLGSLQDQHAVERAAIPVEHINGPILLLSGTEDTVWPASTMCEQAIKRLRQHQFGFQFQHLKYEGAGHLVAGLSRLTPARSPQAQAMTLGGTEGANTAARDDAWTQVRGFFDTHLK
jgi:dienelactone hydrolase